jgi:cytochrome c oxidase subunit 4
MDAAVSTYYRIFVLLLVLLAATLLVSYLPLGPFGLLLALAIAAVKALLVMLYFMHLRWESGVVRLFAFAGFFWFTLLLLITLSDYLARVPPFPE